MNSSTPLTTTAKRLVAVLLTAAAGLAHQAQAATPAQAVGLVTLSLGKAVIIDASGQATAVRKGSQIHAGDRIETAEGGHVHIRFVDGALVSVRPTSRLEVEDYQYNAQQVDKSLVRFRLDKGVARAISGAAAEGARERFRLNTPLVAIGVRGTDFVVRADSSQTLASVNQGAIVVAPFGEGCQVQATGPCNSGSAKLLTAAMGNMLVEYRNHFAQPEIKPLGTMVAESGGSSATAGSQTVVASASRNAPDQQLFRESRKGDDTVTAALLQGGGQVDGVIKTPVTPVTPVDPNLPTKPEIPSKPAFVPSMTDALVWGRFSGMQAVDNDISLNATADQFKAAGKQQLIQNGNNTYRLYRDASVASVLQSNLGVLNFGLQQSQASFIAASGATQAASVLGGTLQVNFSSLQFNTSLNVSSAATGLVGLQAAGRLDGGQGTFYSRTADLAVAGGLTLDAKSAGYFFEKAAAGGTLSGITLWGR